MGKCGLDSLGKGGSFVMLGSEDVMDILEAHLISKKAVLKKPRKKPNNESCIKTNMFNIEYNFI